MVLPREFYARGALEVAPTLLGCVIERESPDGLVAVMLTEVEAYAGAADPASHAYRGRTARNTVMFGPPGHAYVYFTYGMHFCVNLVCLPEGTASAVLLRAGRVIEGAKLAAERRSRPGAGEAGPARSLSPARLRDLARGPARLCQALGVTRSLDGADVCEPGSPLRVRRGSAQAVPAGLMAVAAARDLPGGEDTALLREPGPLPGLVDGSISRGPRVGVSAASGRPWRFWLTADPSVSVYRPHTPRRPRRR